MMRRITQTCLILLFTCDLIWIHAAPSSRPHAQKQESTLGGIDAQALFASKCATCHGKDGRAKTFKAKFNHARNLTDGAWQESVSDEHLYNSIMRGKGKMPAFGKKLREEDVNALVAFVRKFKK